MTDRCTRCQKQIRGDRSRETGLCGTCRAGNPNLVVCPKCNGRTMAKYLAKHSSCEPCMRKAEKAGGDLTGVEREKALREFAAWLNTTRTPWERAVGGLRMFVPADDSTASWP